VTAGALPAFFPAGNAFFLVRRALIKPLMEGF
jgi:hypothetical protein